MAEVKAKTEKKSRKAKQLTVDQLKTQLYNRETSELLQVEKIVKELLNIRKTSLQEELELIEGK